MNIQMGGWPIVVVTRNMFRIFLAVMIFIFRAIFDLSNKIALLILLRMFALYAEKKSLKLKIEN